MAEGRLERNSTSKIRQFLKLLFVKDQVIKSNADDHWQKAVYKLNQIRTEHGLTTSAKKTNPTILKDTIQIEINLQQITKLYNT
jgi:hypothetical protein